MKCFRFSLVAIFFAAFFGSACSIHLPLNRQFQLKEQSDIRVDRIEFNKFLQTFQRIYFNETEHERRFKIFQKNLKLIELLNHHEQGTGFYGVTKWADLTGEEFSRLATGLRPDVQAPHNFMHKPPVWDRDASLPDSWDWRDKGAVTKVKDQGMCGSCWAFSTTGNIEGVKQVVDGTLYSLSEEQLVECDTVDHGCDGGYMTNAYQSVEKMGGLETEEEYPYKGLFFKTCHMNDTAFKVDIDSYTTLGTNENDLAQYMQQKGPISIGINAFVMQFYMRGISHPPHWLCSPKKIDHGVLIVGYGVATKRSKQIPYWIVKNSWGSSWGRQGYYYVYRGDGTCGLNTMASSVVINS